MTCYKCHSPNDLSVKKTQRGIKTYICKSCRREEHKQWRKKGDLLDAPLVDEAVWYRRFRVNHQNLLKHPGNVRVPFGAREVAG